MKLQKERLAGLEPEEETLPDIELPKTTYGKARVVMTRPGEWGSDIDRMSESQDE